MIVIKTRGGLGALETGLNLFSKTQIKASTVIHDPVAGGSSASVQQPSAIKAVNTANAAYEGQQAQCEAGCSADPNVASDADTFRRCVDICKSTGDIQTAITNAQHGSFCWQAYLAMLPTLGEVSPTDQQALFDQCVQDPAAFLQRAKDMGIDLGVEDPFADKTWYKKPGVWILGAGALILGALVIRKRRNR